MDELKVFKNVHEKIQTALNLRLLESSNALLHDIYDTLSTPDKLLLNKQITPEILHYLQPALKIDLSFNQSLKNNRVQLNPQKRCLARVGTLQCSRGRLPPNPDGTINEFCNGHSKALPYGRIDGPLEGKALRLRKASGRKSATVKKTPKTAYSMAGLNPDDYIRTEKITFDGKDYLVDEFGVFYSCDVANTIVGQIKDDKIYWFN